MLTNNSLRNFFFRSGFLIYFIFSLVARLLYANDIDDLLNNINSGVSKNQVCDQFQNNSECLAKDPSRSIAYWDCVAQKPNVVESLPMQSSCESGNALVTNFEVMKKCLQGKQNFKELCNNESAVTKNEDINASIDAMDLCIDNLSKKISVECISEMRKMLVSMRFMSPLLGMEKIDSNIGYSPHLVSLCLKYQNSFYCMTLASFLNVAMVRKMVRKDKNINDIQKISVALCELNTAGFACVTAAMSYYYIEEIETAEKYVEIGCSKQSIPALCSIKNKQDSDENLSVLKSKCYTNNIGSCNDLATLANNLEIRAQLKDALDIRKITCKQGSAHGCNSLGDWFRKLDDNENALFYHRKACKMGQTAYQGYGTDSCVEIKKIEKAIADSNPPKETKTELVTSYDKNLDDSPAPVSSVSPVSQKKIIYDSINDLEIQSVKFEKQGNFDKAKLASEKLCDQNVLSACLREGIQNYLIRQKKISENRKKLHCIYKIPGACFGEKVDFEELIEHCQIDDEVSCLPAAYYAIHAPRKISKTDSDQKEEKNLAKNLFKKAKKTRNYLAWHIAILLIEKDKNKSPKIESVIRSSYEEMCKAAYYAACHRLYQMEEANLYMKNIREEMLARNCSNGFQPSCMEFALSKPSDSAEAAKIYEEACHVYQFKPACKKVPATYDPAEVENPQKISTNDFDEEGINSINWSDPIKERRLKSDTSKIDVKTYQRTLYLNNNEGTEIAAMKDFEIGNINVDDPDVVDFKPVPLAKPEKIILKPQKVGKTRIVFYAIDENPKVVYEIEVKAEKPSK